MTNTLDRDYGFGSLLKFALPSIIMMIFMSLYTVVDGFFVARFVGADALSAVNIAYPMTSGERAGGGRRATGGSAVVARRLGEGDEKAAREGFALLLAAGLIAGVLFTVLGLTLAEPMSRLLGASPALLGYCTDYLRILMAFAPAYILQLMFQSFFVVAGRPGLGLWLTVAAGLANMVLDYVFIVPLGLGIAGAALATAAGYLIPAAAGAAFFALRRHGLRFIRPRWDARMLLYSCLNGSSEMVTNLASAVITFLFNMLMLRYLGEDGVAAITIVLYAQFLLTALYMGFSMGVAPIISFNYGAENTHRLKSVFRSCMIFVAVSSVAVFIAAMAFSGGIVGVFSPPGTAVFDIAVAGFCMFAPMILFAGLNIFASALFTALSDGRTSALLAFLRTFGFILLGLLVLPIAFGVDGVWLAVPFAELLAGAVSVGCILWGRKRYHYA